MDSSGHLREHVPLIIASSLFYYGVQLLSPYLSPRLSKHYPSLKPKTRREWDVRVVSTVNTLTVLPLAITCFKYQHILAEDKAFASHPAALRLAAIAAGYFLWDTAESVSRLDIPFMIHGLSSMLIFIFGLTPFVLYYAPISLMWELSTPFLNIHWFLDKTKRTGSPAQLVNGGLLLLVFFAARICYGSWASYDLFKTLYRVRHDIPTWMSGFYLCGNVSLNVLNWIWFFKMIDALRRRFSDKEDGRKTQKVAVRQPAAAAKEL